VVFHLAAIPSIPYSFLYPQDVFEINALGSLNLLNAARDFRPAKIVLASSSETYGDSKYVPIDEQHPQFPKSPYAASKVAMEKLAWSFFCTYELPIIIVRPFNTYGPRQSARAITPTIITQLLVGDDIRIGALHPKRDFTFVLDTVEAFIKVAELNYYGNVFNVGCNVSISVQEIIDKVSSILAKKEIRIITDEFRIRPGQSEVEALRANYAQLKEATGWEPRFRHDEGLKVTIEWVEKNIDSYKPQIYNI